MRNGLVNLGSLFQMLFMELSTFMLQSHVQIRVKSVDHCRRVQNQVKGQRNWPWQPLKLQSDSGRQHPVERWDSQNKRTQLLQVQLDHPEA